MVVGTLLGPEGTGRPREGEGLVVSFRATWVSYRRCPCGGRGAGGVVWTVSGRSLRTAQWTRASSDSVLQGL